MAKLKRCPKCGWDNRYQLNIVLECGGRNVPPYAYKCRHCGTRTKDHNTRQFAKNEWNRMAGFWRKESEG